MAYDLKFLRGTSTNFDGLVSKDNKTFYYLTDTNKLYIGSHELTDNFTVSATAVEDESGNVNVITGITVADGAASKTEQLLKKVAVSGDAEDLAYDGTTSGLAATDVQAAIDELADATGDGVESKTVYVVESTGGSGDAYSKRYAIYQGADGSAADPDVNEKLVDIDIPKDMVVAEGAVVDITYDSTEGKLYDGVTDVTAIIKGSDTPSADDAGKYIRLTIANATNDKIYIKATDLVDIYTVEENATQVQLVIDNTNEISATIVAGSIDTTELADDAVTTAKIADDAVTADKIAISAHAETQTAGADGLALSVTTTDGQVSAVSGSIAANTYDAYGDAAAALATAIGENGDAASADTIYGAKAYADEAASDAATDAVEALDFTEAAIAEVSNHVVTIHGVSETDGVIAIGSAPANDIVLEEVAHTGAAADVSIADAGSQFTATTVEGALDELAGILTWGSIPAPAAGD